LIEKNFVGSVLVEKPIFDRSEKLKPNRFNLLAVGYNLRFHPAIIWLQETLPKLGAISSANLYVGQYLPTWRPDSDYQNSSSAKTDAGGGVLRDLSHELDLVQYIFGDWNKLTAIGGKFSDLEIETDDTFSILMQTDQCAAVSVQMNYSDRLRQRLITVNGNNGTIQIDLVRNSATFNNSQKSFDVQPDCTYVFQHNAVIHNQDLSICSLADALKVVATIEAVEKSAKKSKWITK
jgi:predicted dehydrogenase